MLLKNCGGMATCDLPQRHREHREMHSRLNPITDSVIGAAIEVHRTIGPGLLESAYEECLCHELRLRQITFQRQVPLLISVSSVPLW